MLQKVLVCVMAVLVCLSAFTVTAFFAADSVLVVNPSDRKSSSGSLGMVENEVVDIPSDLLDEPSGDSESSGENSGVESSSALPSSSAPSSVISSALPPSNSSTVTIPSSLPSSSDPSGGEAQEETLIVKISTEVSVGIYAVSDILPRVVAMEMSDTFADEALKAQAVATHSYIKYQNSVGKAPVVYVRTPSARIRSLVNSVADKLIYCNGAVINASYCASTAGRTQSSADVWGGHLSYLVSVESVYDNLDPNWGSKTTYTADQVKTMVKNNAGIDLTGDPSGWLKVLTMTSGGYNGDMSIGSSTTFVNGGSTYKITGRYIREIILKQSGLPALKSPKFDISVSGDQLTFTTYGYGHGVGMSQWGAHYYAQKAGYGYQQILTHYYTGVTVR